MVVVEAEAAPPEGAVELVGTSIGPKVGMSELGRLVGGDDNVPPSLWPAGGETVVVDLDPGVVGGGVGKGLEAGAVVVGTGVGEPPCAGEQSPHTP